MFNCTVLLNTDERKTPHINGAKTGVVLTQGMTWIATDYRTADNNGLGMWVKTPSGNWTCASYPRPDNTIKTYVRVQEIDPDPPLPPPSDVPIPPFKFNANWDGEKFTFTFNDKKLVPEK